MQKKLWIKAAVVAVLMLILLIPLGMIQGLVNERANRQGEVVADIAASSAGAQHLLGPVLAVPFTEYWKETVETTAQNGQSKKRQEDRWESRAVYFIPEQLDIAGAMVEETKQRGLFKVRSYVLDAEFKGRFAVPAGFGKPQPQHKGSLVFGKPYLALGVADMRGVLEAPGLDWNGQRHAFEQGAGLAMAMPGMKVTLDEWADAAQAAPFAFTLKLRGMESLDFVPTGGQTHVALSSAWPHPGFYGRFLPDPGSQSVSAEGFRADWKVNALASNVAGALGRCNELNCFDSFGIRLVDPVNIYSMSDRATKYGFLFVCLTFTAIFLYESIKRLAVHPAQYTLVGLALAMFFLLLLSLSEHIGFPQAYLAAASACVGLIAFYLSAAVPNAGLGIGGLLAVLFAALYGLLQSEDNSLMLGSLLLFALLGAAMAATRKVDWYQLGAPDGDLPLKEQRPTPPAKDGS